MSQPSSSEYQSRFNPSSPSRRERSNLVEDVEQERNIREKLTPKVQPVRLPTA